MTDFFKLIQREVGLQAYAVTGNEQFLKNIPPLRREPVGFNDPVHLPLPMKGPCIPAPEFDVFDDDLMKDCIGGKLTQPVQALLITLSHWDVIPKEAIADTVKLELMKLREAVKEEYRAL